MRLSSNNLSQVRNFSNLLMEIEKKYRNLGNTDLLLSPIGLGTWQFSKRKNLIGKFWPELSDSDSFDIVRSSYENGVNWFDTAELYGNGESERTLVRALKDAGIKDANVAIATKWSPFFRTAGSILKTFDAREKDLDGYTISLHQIHSPNSFSSIKKEMEAMATLADQQKIKYVGVSNFSAKQMRNAYQELDRRGYVLASNQVKYNLIERKIEFNETMKVAKELGIAIIAYSPLAQGLLTGKYHDNPESIRSEKGVRKLKSSFKQKGLEKSRPLVDLLRSIAQKHGVTPAQVALNWVLSFHGKHVFAIPGARNAEQAKSNAVAMKIELSQDEMNKLDEVSQSAG